MEINLEDFEINSADIWKYEQSLFLREKTPDELGKKIINKIEGLIFNEGTASYGASDFKKGNNQYKEYHSRQKKMHDVVLKNVVERYRLNFFFIKESCFEYDQSIIIKSDNIDFDFWFALKLRQYDSKTLGLIKFLDVQLITNFKNDIQEFVKFLKFGILKDQSKILSKEILETLDGWINRNNIRQVSNKNKQKMKGEINSFLLKDIEFDTTNSEKRREIRQMFHKFFFNLKKSKFISNDTSFDNFIAIFSNKQISKNNRITWIGTNVELQWFIKYLVYHYQKVKDLKKDIWFVTVKCFVNSNKEEFTTSQLRDAKGKKLQRMILLEEILSKL